MRVAVMGGGSWGTAFAMILADAGCEATMWAREPSLAEAINSTHENSRYHPGIALPESIVATGDPQEALAEAEIVVLAVPSQSLRVNLASWRDHVAPGSVLVSLMKGVELGTTMRMSEVIADVALVDPSRVAVVSGPNLAREIAQRQPAATTVACPDAANARMLADACTTGYFRPYWTTDVVGTEIGGAVKNVIALANGLAVGIGLGENTQASLITRGLAEMSRLGRSLGADPMTFLGLAGIGDLVATCQSPLSRNRTFGEHLGHGLSIAEATAATTQTCEGVKSCGPILELAQRQGIEMPITEQIVEVVRNGKAPRDVLRDIMSRATRAESGAT